MPKTTPLRIALIAAAALLAGCNTAPPLAYTVPSQPEGSSGTTEKPGWATEKFAVAAANPLATDAGYQVLKAGGSAIDAAIAVQMVLTLVEPQSSGIGGGAFLLHAAGARVEAYDGRETAPAAVTDKLFIGADGKPLPFNDAVVGGRSVGVPGTVRMLELAHREHGKLAWAQLFEPAIQLAEGGFKVSARLNTLLANDKFLSKDPVAAAYFYDTAGKPWPVGHVLKNPELAAVLRAIARQGSKALLEGDVAQAIVAKVRTHPTNPGQLSLADLAGYQPKKREALCSSYQVAPHDYRVCGFPPPSSGAIAIGQILGILQNTNAAAMPLQDGLRGPAPGADWLHLYTEAARLAFADRALYVADPDFVQPPRRQLDEPAGARLSGQPRPADRCTKHEGGATGHAGRPAHQLCPHARAARIRHQPHQHRGRLWQRGGHDYHHRRPVWLTPDGHHQRRAPRGLFAQQRTHRLQLCPHRRAGPAHCQPRAAGQAAALVHGAHAGV